MKNTKRKRSTTTYDVKDLESDIKRFIRKMHDLDKIKDPEVKNVVDGVMMSTAMAYAIQLMYKYWGVNLDVISKINMKGPGAIT